MNVLANRGGELDWNLLRTFFIIVEERSLTRAADRLNMRQPSVSAALQRLEAALGCSLVVRASRRFELTRYGELLHAECAAIFRNVSRIQEKLAGAEKDVTGTVRILSVTDVQYPPLDRALAELHARYPAIQFQIDIVISREGTRAVSRQLAPFAFCLLTKPIHGLDCRFLVREEFGIYCGEHHPGFGRNDLTLDDLRHEPFIGFTCATDGGALEPILALGSGNGLGSRLNGTSTHLTEVVRMIRAGVGIGILPVASVEREVVDGKLWRFEPEDISLGADLYLVTNPTMPVELAEAKFLDIFNNCVNEYQPAQEPRSGEH